MSVPILSCPCGLRMKAKGATPGRVGRCPKCGRTLRVPGAEPATVEAEVQTIADANADDEVVDEPVARGYGVQPAAARTVARPSPISAEFGHAPERKKKGTQRAEVAARLPDPVREIEPWWRPDVLFPLRKAEGLMMVAMMGLIFWVLTVLIPELCLEFVASSAKFGANLMGYLIGLIAGLPSLIFTPIAIVYALQYQGRVLVSGAMGEVVPPRPPDRNFDGLLQGLGPWVVWLTCGASIGFGPLASYAFSRGWDSPMNPWIAGALAAIGLPYVLMSLMMALLHEHGIPQPLKVVAALIRFNLGFLGISAIVGGLALIVWGAFAAVFSLRENYFWAYIVIMLGFECLAQWMMIVAMRVLGVYYHHHASLLKWHREKPWWGMIWGI